MQTHLHVFCKLLTSGEARDEVVGQLAHGRDLLEVARSTSRAGGVGKLKVSEVQAIDIEANAFGCDRTHLHASPRQFHSESN
eukprot:4036888-Alexandrium_andersonii.AAC.1